MGVPGQWWHAQRLWFGQAGDGLVFAERVDPEAVEHVVDRAVRGERRADRARMGRLRRSHCWRCRICGNTRRCAVSVQKVQRRREAWAQQLGEPGTSERPIDISGIIYAGWPASV